MAQVTTNDIKAGMKLEMEGQPYIVVLTNFVKPGKAQPFARIKLKGMLTGKVIERTMKTGEMMDIADVVESQMRMLYTEGAGVVFMHDETYEQLTIQKDVIGDAAQWLVEDLLYDVVFYKGVPVQVVPPTFLELEITETAPGHRGDTASGRVLKPATVQTGAQIQVPIFVETGEIVKIDTRTGEYVSRVGK
jgi:elongation factor P